MSGLKLHHSWDRWCHVHGISKFDSYEESYKVFGDKFVLMKNPIATCHASPSGKIHFADKYCPGWENYLNQCIRYSCEVVTLNVELGISARSHLRHSCLCLKKDCSIGSNEDRSTLLNYNYYHKQCILCRSELTNLLIGINGRRIVTGQIPKFIENCQEQVDAWANLFCGNAYCMNDKKLYNTGRNAQKTDYWCPECQIIKKTEAYEVNITDYTLQEKERKGVNDTFMNLEYLTKSCRRYTLDVYQNNILPVLIRERVPLDKRYRFTYQGGLINPDRTIV